MPDDDGAWNEKSDWGTWVCWLPVTGASVDEDEDEETVPSDDIDMLESGPVRLWLRLDGPWTCFLRASEGEAGRLTDEGPALAEVV